MPPGNAGELYRSSQDLILLVDEYCVNEMKTHARALIGRGSVQYRSAPTPSVNHDCDGADALKQSDALLLLCSRA
jgi:hypothetical protein